MLNNRNKPTTTNPGTVESSEQGPAVEAGLYPSVWQRSAAALRQFGLLSGLWRLAARLLLRIRESVFHRDHYYVIATDLKRVTAERLPLADRLDISRMTVGDIGDTAALWDDEHIEYKLLQFRNRLESGSVGYIARYKGRVVAGSWTAMGRHEEPMLGVKLRLAPGVCYGYDTFVHPDCRGRGFAVDLISWIIMELKQAGYRRRVVLTHDENLAIIRSYAKMGQYAVGELTRKRMFGINRIFWEIDNHRGRSNILDVGI